MIAARSWLFCPGDRPSRFERALRAGADRVILDLEDGVAAEHKEAARAAVAAWLSPEHPVWVRVNGAETDLHGADLAAVCRPGLAGIVLPKAEDSATVRAVARRLASVPGTALAPLVETARGLWRARRLAAASPLVERLAFGALDLALDLAVAIGADERELLAARTHVVVASRVAGVAPPIDGITLALDDEATLVAASEAARRLGFDGKLAIHPRQIGPINAAFAPSDEEIAWARRIIGTFDAAASGAVAIDGIMVDRPVVERARRIVQGLPD